MYKMKIIYLNSKVINKILNVGKYINFLRITCGDKDVIFSLKIVEIIRHHSNKHNSRKLRYF